MDSSKVGRSDFARLCNVDRVDAILTEKSVEALERLCERAGVELIVAE